MNGAFYAESFGAVGDGNSHPLSDYFATLADAQAIYPHATALTNEIDWAAIQAAVRLAAVPRPGSSTRYVRGGAVILGRGRFLCDQPIDIGANAGGSISIQGISPPGPATQDIAGATSLVYTGSGPRFIDARSTFGFTMERLSVAYSAALFSGVLVDFSHKTVSDSSHATLRDCSFGSLESTPLVGARALVSFWNAVLCLVDNCIFGAAVSAIRFQELIPAHSSYSNAHVVQNSAFMYHRWSLVNAGQMLTINGCSFEGTDGGLESAYYTDIPLSRLPRLLSLRSRATPLLAVPARLSTTGGSSDFRR